MSNELFGLLALVALFGAIFIGFPIAFTLGAVALGAGFVAFGPMVFDLAVLQTFSVMKDTVLASIPFFLFMGFLLEQSGLMERMFTGIQQLLAGVRGSLYLAVLITATIFAAATGIVGSAVTLLGVMAGPAMIKSGYDAKLSAGAIAAGGTLGILIPPSVPLVIYAILTEQNIAKLFAAAMIPGAIAMLGYVAAIAIYVRLVPGQAPEHDDDAPGLSVRAVWGVLPILVIFLIVFGGIYGGLFTPTEGAAVGSAATFLAALAKREMTWKKFGHCFYATAEASAMIFMIFLGADLMNSALTLTQVPNQLANLVQGWGLSPFMVVAAIVALYIALGCLMDELSVLLLTIPIFFPVVIGLDFGMPQESVALWFGIVVLMTVSFGLLSPPVGLNVYVVNGMARDVPIAESYRGVLPFLASDLVRLLLLMFFPVLSLWLVQFVG